MSTLVRQAEAAASKRGKAKQAAKKVLREDAATIAADDAGKGNVLCATNHLDTVLGAVLGGCLEQHIKMPTCAEHVLLLLLVAFSPPHGARLSFLCLCGILILFTVLGCVQKELAPAIDIGSRGRGRKRKAVNYNEASNAQPMVRPFSHRTGMFGRARAILRLWTESETGILCDRRNKSRNCRQQNLVRWRQSLRFLRQAGAFVPVDLGPTRTETGLAAGSASVGSVSQSERTNFFGSNRLSRLCLFCQLLLFVCSLRLKMWLGLWSQTLNALAWQISIWGRHFTGSVLNARAVRLVTRRCTRSPQHLFCNTSDIGCPD